MIVSPKKLFDLAYGNYAIGAYNIHNLEQTLGLFRGNLDSQAPFIVQVSSGAFSYTHPKMLEGLIRIADEIFPGAVFAVHLDHGDEETCYECIRGGFCSSVMIDASHEDFETNVAITRRVVEAAHTNGVIVEAELGQLGGIEEHLRVEGASASLTDPDQAKEFVERTGVDSLACAIGTSHGAYKFAGSQDLRPAGTGLHPAGSQDLRPAGTGLHPAGSQDLRPAGTGLHLDVLAEIQRRLPGFPLVMHGASSVPPEEVARINAAGGALKGARGVDEGQFRRAAELGVTKINIDTDGRLVWTRVHREYFRDHPETIDFRPMGKVFMEEYARFIAAKSEKLGSAGQLGAVRRILSEDSSISLDRFKGK